MCDPVLPGELDDPLANHRDAFAEMIGRQRDRREDAEATDVANDNAGASVQPDAFDQPRPIDDQTLCKRVAVMWPG